MFQTLVIILQVQLHRDVRPQPSVHSPTPAHSHGMLYLQHFVTQPTAHGSENYSKHKSLI